MPALNRGHGVVRWALCAIVLCWAVAGPAGAGAQDTAPGVCQGSGVFVGDGTFDGEGTFSSAAGTFKGTGVFQGDNSTFEGVAKCSASGTMKSTEGGTATITGSGFFSIPKGGSASIENATGTFNVEGPWEFTSDGMKLDGVGQLFGEGEIEGEVTAFGDFMCDGEGNLSGKGSLEGTGSLLADGRFTGEGTLTGSGSFAGEGACTGDSVSVAMAPLGETNLEDGDSDTIARLNEAEGFAFAPVTADAPGVGSDADLGVATAPGAEEMSEEEIIRMLGEGGEASAPSGASVAAPPLGSDEDVIASLGGAENDVFAPAAEAPEGPSDDEIIAMLGGSEGDALAPTAEAPA